MNQKRISTIITILICISLMFSLSACKNKKDDADAEEKETTIDTFYNADTQITYSSGSDSNWAYGNQRKEFPISEKCYVRIGSTVATEKRKGVGTEITVTYKFTGAKNCKIELSDGLATKSDSGDSDVVIYTTTISAAKKKKAKENIAIFQYTPSSGASSITLDVTYDDHVPTQYDAHNTIYFSNSVKE